jgi:hypothetical protein
MTDIKKGNRQGLFMIAPISTVSAVLRKYDGNYTLENKIRIEWFSAYAVVSSQGDNLAAHGVFLDLVEEWETIEPAFREAFQQGMDIPELFFEIGTLWLIERDHAPSDEVTYQRLCPYMLNLKGDRFYSGDCDEAEA